MTDSLIHLRVPAALKGRWVRASRAAGMLLTDWIIEAVETHTMTEQRLITGAHMTYADLSRIRDEWGLTNREMAAVLGVSLSTYEGWGTRGNVPLYIQRHVETLLIGIDSGVINLRPHLTHS